MNEEQMIKRDRMRFKKNKASANLTLLAIVFDVIYLIRVYQQDAGNYYYNYMIGISIVYNLVFLLAAFLSEEGVKNYRKGYSYPLLILGVIQVARIFILPWRASHYVDPQAGFVEPPMSNSLFLFLAVLLILSAVCLVAAAVINLVKCNALASHMKMLESRSAGTEALAGKSA